MDEEYTWANVERPKKEKEEEVKACSIEDPTCEACGS